MTHDMLSQFIRYLEDEHMVKFVILDKGERGFRNRFRIQKYVFLAKRFGLELPYKHDIYLYGPYSPDLASAYYDLANDASRHRIDTQNLPESFRKKDFLGTVKDKNDDWLEIATTLMARKASIPKRNMLVQNVKDTKIGFKDSFIKDVLDDLVCADLIEFDQ